jgi:hypothetical protein
MLIGRRKAKSIAPSDRPGTSYTIFPRRESYTLPRVRFGNLEVLQHPFG